MTMKQMKRHQLRRLIEAISKEQETRMKNLKRGDYVTVYHGTDNLELPKLINGFDTTEPHYRSYNRVRHRGLFVTLDHKTARDFGRIILEIRVRAKQVHGTDYSGNISRHESEKSKEYFRAKSPQSFKPGLTDSMLSAAEPQGLLIGLVSPKQILRVWEDDKWFSRIEYIKKKKMKDLQFDASSPSISIEDFARLLGKSKEAVDKVFSRKKTHKYSHWNWAFKKLNLGSKAIKSLISKLEKQFDIEFVLDWD